MMVVFKSGRNIAKDFLNGKDRYKLWVCKDDYDRLINKLRFALDGCQEFCLNNIYHHIEYAEAKEVFEKIISNFEEVRK